MYAILTIARYKKRFIYFALLAMALHRIPLLLNRAIRFHKTLGCGRDGTFSKWPDWQQWGILVVVDAAVVEAIKGSDNEQDQLKSIYGSMIPAWWRFFGCETWTVLLQPIEGHGSWDGKAAFGELPTKSDYEGRIAILTRATIRGKQLARFHAHVEAISNDMRAAEGFLFSVGIGESPRLRQATFSIWNSKEQMKQFAYKMHHHAAVIQKTRKENWYSEDMFVRFKIIRSFGSIKGSNPIHVSSSK